MENRAAFYPFVAHCVLFRPLYLCLDLSCHQECQTLSPKYKFAVAAGENKTGRQKHLEEFLLPSLLLQVFSLLKEMNGVLIGLLIFWGVFKRLVVYFYFYLNKISSCILSVWGHKNSNNKLNEQSELHVTPKYYSHLCVPEDLSKITMKQSEPLLSLIYLLLYHASQQPAPE